MSTVVDEAPRVIVLGSGIAGMSAALSAIRAGARVTVLEKSETFGGSAALSAGMFWTAPSVDALRSRIPLGDPVLGRRVVDDYAAALQEVRDTGVDVAAEPMHGIMTFGIGHSFDVRGWLAAARDTIAASGELAAGVRTLRLIADDEGVHGVVVRRADDVVEELHGAVVLATGGFQGDVEELGRHLGGNADRLVLRSNPGSVGDGLRLARAAGSGGTRPMSSFYGHLLPAPMGSFGAEDFLPYSQYYSSDTVLVNRAGVRFVDETLGDEILNQALVHQSDAFGVLVFDDHIRTTKASDEPFPGLGVNDRFATAVAAGAQHATASTLPELIDAVEGWGVDPAGLARTLDAYAPGTILDGVPVAPDARRPQTAPFHALRVQPSITFTFGGVRIDDSGRALDHDGRPVPGLFAAGADIGGLSDVGYAGGLAPAYITGRWAGRTAAERAREPIAARIGQETR